MKTNQMDIKELKNRVAEIKILQSHIYLPAKIGQSVREHP